MATIDKIASVRLKSSSRLSLKAAQKQLSDISPAPVPRSSHRIRTLSAESEDKVAKTNVSSKRSQNLSPSSSYYNSLNNNADCKEQQFMSFFNGFGPTGRAHGICPLANLGNTCFLNSVLYALRFLPGFVHDLHHLYSYLKTTSQEIFTSALTQRINFLSELHNVFTLLKNEEYNCLDGKKIPALHPIQFLESLRSVNPQFEGNRQQDAHELLHCLLDQLFNLPQDLITDEHQSREGTCSPKSKRRRRSNKPKDLNASKVFDIVGSKFVGKMSLETRCVECEQINSREESFLEVCVPVKTKSDVEDDEDVNDTEILLNALCTEEGLVGSNKYWCDFCCHHNEAERSVHYRELPHNLLIHVKRFSSFTRTFAGKCCDAMPAPFQLPCFCHECLQDKKNRDRNFRQNGLKGDYLLFPKSTKCGRPNSDNTHLPYFLTAFVCHLGATMSSGHYVSFVHVNSRSLLSSCLERNLKRGNSWSSGDADDPCSFLSCCSSHLDRIMSTSSLPNGTSKNLVSDQSNGVWLECDDDKIKIVSSSEVAAVMNSNNLTPYLLFYSR